MTTNTVKHRPDAREWQDISSAPTGVWCVVYRNGSELPAIAIHRPGMNPGVWASVNDGVLAPHWWLPLGALPAFPPAPQEKGRG